MNVKQNRENVFINQERNIKKLVAKEIILDVLQHIRCDSFYSEEKLIDKITDKLCKILNFKIENMIEIIIEKIRENFPGTNIQHEIIGNNEVFINVDKQTYRTIKYQTFVMSLQTEILWKQNFNGFYFGEIDEH